MYDDNQARGKEIARIESLANLLDSRWRIPGTGIRFGADAVLGLVPGLGDGASAVVSAYLIWRAHGHGAPASLISRMALNVVFDTVIGSVPFAGSVFDVFYRANNRNAALLVRHLEEKRESARDESGGGAS